MARQTPQFRKTRKRYEYPNHVRFLTFSCFQRLPLFNNDKIKDAFVESIITTKKQFPFHLHAWVIMPEHVHLLMMPNLPDYPAETVLQHLKSHLSNRVLRRWRELNAPILNRIIDSRGKHRFWQQGGGYDRNIYSSQEFEEKFDYIHSNPVSRQLVDKPFDWKWSSARWYEDGGKDALLEMDPINFL